MNLTLMTDKEILTLIAKRAKEVRILNDFRQLDLSERSGIPLSSVRVFERSGVISFAYLVKLLRALGIIEELNALFKQDAIRDLQSAITDATRSRKRVRK